MASPVIPTPIAPPTRPGAIGIQRPSAWPSALGIIGIVLASVSCLMSLIGLVTPMIMGVFEKAIPNSRTVMQVQHDYAGIIRIEYIFGMLLAVLLLWASIETMRRRPRGPLWLQRWAWLKCVETGFITWTTLAIQQAQLKLGMVQGSPGQGQAIAAAITPLILVFTALGVVAWYASYPIFAIIWLRRRRIRAEVATWRAQTPGASPA